MKTKLENLLEVNVLIIAFITLISQILFASEIKITASDGADSCYFGATNSISGNYAIIGAYGDNNDTGAAYIYFFNGSSWIQQAKLTADDGAENDNFGNSVSLDGDYAIIGAFKAVVSGDTSGAAYIFKRSGTVWSQQSKIVAVGIGNNKRFGWSVSLSGEYAVIGASFSGAAYFFRRSGSSWNQDDVLYKYYNEFGYSVSIDGDYAVVGSNGEGACTYLREGLSWSEQAELTPEGSSSNFGISTAISGDYAVVGDNMDSHSSTTWAGSVHVFKRSGTSWDDKTKIIASDPQTQDLFGSSVSIYNNYLIVGAIGEGGSYRGAAYSFLRNGSTWTETSKLLASDQAVSDNYGVSVSINSDFAIIGAYQDDDNGTNSGSSYIYETGSDMSLPVKLASFTATAGDGQVTLNWVTESEVNNEAFILERSDDGETFYQIAEFEGSGTTSARTDYSYTDSYVINGITYHFRLSDRDINGVITYHSTVQARPNSAGISIYDPDAVVNKFQLYANYPNPFNPETTIIFDMPTVNNDQKEIKLIIFNAIGQLVTTLYSGTISGGRYSLKWDGRNTAGINQPSGVYFLNLQSAQFVQSRKMVLVR